MQNVASLLTRLSRLCNIAKNFQLEFSKTPLKKTICFVMGEQSSGKSSFINYFLHDLPIRQTGSQAIDSHFTIIETVSEREFEMLCRQSNRTYVKNTKSSWDERLPKQFFNKEKYKHVLELDDRYGRVWLDLTPLQKSTRYKQFFDGEMKEILYTNHELLHAVVVNEKYVQCTELEAFRKDKVLEMRREELRRREEEKAKQKQREEESKKTRTATLLDNCIISDYMEDPLPDDEAKAYLVDNALEEEELYRPLVKDVIFIDSPGFNDDSLLENVEKFKCFVNMLEFFYKQASLCLFLVSPDHMKSIGNSLKILQLTVLDYETKSKLFDEAHSQMKQQLKQEETNGNSGGVGSSLVKMVLGGALDILETKAKMLMKTMIPLPLPSFPGSRKGKQNKNQNYRYIGPSLYEKLYFVINKIDLCENESNAFFELGVSMGKHFKHLPVPNSDHIVTCGCPMEQRYSKKNIWKIKSFPSIEALNSFFTDEVTTVPLQDLSIGQLQQVEELMQQLRSAENVQKSILNHMRYILEKMEAVFNEWNIVTRFRQNGEMEEARKLCSF